MIVGCRVVFTVYIVCRVFEFTRLGFDHVQALGPAWG